MKYFSTLEEKFRISARPCNILYISSILNLIESILNVLFRFMGLSKPAEARRDKLQDSLVLHRYLANVEEELAWIRDKEPLVKTDDLGRNLIGTVVDRSKCTAIFVFSDDVVTKSRGLL